MYMYKNTLEDFYLIFTLEKVQERLQMLYICINSYKCNFVKYYLFHLQNDIMYMLYIYIVLALMKQFVNMLLTLKNVTSVSKDVIDVYNLGWFSE